MEIDECVAKYHIVLRAGYTEVEPTSGTLAEIESAVERRNQRGRLEGLEDDLNPEVLDPAKVEAFLARLPSLPDETLEKLRDRVLYLDALPLKHSGAITVETLKKGYYLTVPESAPGELVQPTLHAEIDKVRAQDLVKRAREATALFDQEVKERESKVEALPKSSKELSAALGQLSLARWKRCAASMVWLDNSADLAKTDPANAELQAEAKQAQEAAAEYLTAPWVGMPGPG